MNTLDAIPTPLEVLDSLDHAILEIKGRLCTSIALEYSQRALSLLIGEPIADVGGELRESKEWFLEKAGWN